MDRAEEVGRPGQVLQRKLEEQVLPGLALRHFLADPGVIVTAALDGVLEDRRVRGQPGDREIMDVATERAAGQQVARDVVQPDALAGLVKLLGRSHGCSLLGSGDAARTRCGRVRNGTTFGPAGRRSGAAETSVGRSYSRRSAMRSMVRSGDGWFATSSGSCAYWPCRGKTVVTREPQARFTGVKIVSLSSIRM